SPAEFENGHFPNAISFPIFSNDERAIIGTCYKQKGKETAILTGLSIVGPKLSEWASIFLKLASEQKELLFYCWRGGMRSSSMAWLAQTIGIQTYVLSGGYKSYRAWCLQQFEKPRKIVLIGGPTGSGKTELLRYLAANGQAILDLEYLAQHKGSVFGGLGHLPQPTQEQFENQIAESLANVPINQILWIENESIQIGQRTIPLPLWKQMKQAPVIELQLDETQRIQRIVAEYSTFPINNLITSVQKLHKKLGNERMNQIIQAIQNRDFFAATKLLFHYYDHSYQKQSHKQVGKRIPLYIEAPNEPQTLSLLNEIVSTIPFLE
ncbi:MAG: tRNA 2-selenouridine(34) synthase MnmH, partial [Bacteroidia bacterium]|nr:tRNA 2-selenouridine(34) synthase MnmH [Bacteroidia bacterium]